MTSNYSSSFSERGHSSQGSETLDLMPPQCWLRAALDGLHFSDYFFGNVRPCSRRRKPEWL